MRYVLSLLFLLSFAPLFAGDPPAVLAPEVQKIVDDRQAIIDKAKAALDTVTAKTTSDAITKLEKVVKDTTKKGDLAGAVAVQKVIDEYKATLGTDLLGNGAGAGKSEFLGKWMITGLKHAGTPINVKEDKTADFGARTGWGTWVLDDQGNLIISWKSGYDYKIVKKGAEITFTEQKGTEVFADGKLVR